MRQISYWLCYHFCQLSDSLGIQTSNQNCIINSSCRVCCSLSILARSTPFKELAKDVVKGLGMDNRRLQFITKSSTFEHRPLNFVDKSNVHEDNAGAIVVATSPRLTPTSKFIAVKYHWFRSHIDPGDGSRPIKICKILGAENPADIFTKSKSGQKGFEDLRMILCGW